MQKIFAIILAVIIVSIILISVLLSPSEIKLASFWLPVSWLVLLATLNWVVSAIFFFDGTEKKENSKKSIGVLPSINILILFYSFISITLLTLNSTKEIIGIEEFMSSYHIIFQISLGSIFTVLILSILIAAKGAESGAENIKTREDLIIELSAINVQYDFEKNNLFNDLVEYVSYKMPHPSSINRSQYNDFILQIEMISNSESRDGIERMLSSILSMAKKLT